MPEGSTVEILKNGEDITSHVLFRDASFELQMGAIPGTFTARCKDPLQVLSFTTGDLLKLIVDGKTMFGGYILQAGRGFAFPADNVPTDPTTFPNRVWTLRGVDFNILFDKRVLRNTADYLTQIPTLTNKYDGELIRDYLTTYLDVPGYIDMVSQVDNVHLFDTYAWKQQGTKWRETMQEFVSFTGALYYIDGDGVLQHHEIDTTVKRWGFSDKPNNGTITTDPGYQDVTIGMREVSGSTDGSRLVSDAFVWGGSMFAGAGGTVFARETNDDSISEHGLWQLAETHFGEQGFGTTAHVAERADLIVNGSPGAVGDDQNRGLRYEQWQFQVSWFAHNVPMLSGARDHIIPGELTTFKLWVFSEDGGVTPLAQLLPLRSVKISFPQLDRNGDGFVRFDGFFGLQPDDPYTLWNFLLKQQQNVQSITLSAVDNDSPAAVPGSIGYFTFIETPNSSRTVFTVPFPYVPSTSQVRRTRGGQSRDLVRDLDYTESSPEDGEFTFPVAPDTGDVYAIIVRTA